MSQKTILALVEALREAGQAKIGAPRYLDQHNAQVDAAAKALVAEIESGERYEKTHCKKCGTPLRPNGKCKDVTCPYSDRQQNETYTEG